MKILRYSFAFLCSASVSYAAITNPCGIDDAIFSNMPFFTGPLITPTSHIVPGGHWNFEPYVYVTSNYGFYNHHWELKTGYHNVAVNGQFPLWIGLNSFMDIAILPQFISRFKDGQSSTQFGDFELTIEFQVLTDTPTNHIPGLKLSFTEVFPSGRYQELSPSKSGVDVGGAGLYQTEIALVASRQFTIGHCHFLSLRTALIYDFAPPSHVQGFHTYGGGFGTDGKIKIGDQITWLAAFEYNLDSHWALACDLEFFFAKSSSFSGKIGKLSNGEPANIDLPTGYQWSLAPAIEYNFNQDVGIIAGAWGTFAGKNMPAFLSGVLAINFYY